jgi:hypothetical protein
MVVPDPRTDHEVVEVIYRLYFAQFVAFDENPRMRFTKNFVPIDIEAIARQLDTHRDNVYSTLQYRLNPRFGLRNGDVETPFFMQSWPDRHNLPEPAKSERHLVNFGLLPGALASMREEHSKSRTALIVSCLAAAAALLALFK